MAEREWKLPLHREGKLMGLKKHRLLDGGEGNQKQSVRIFEEKLSWRGHHCWKIKEKYISRKVERQQQKAGRKMRQGQHKRKVGGKRQASCKARETVWQPLLMGNKSIGSVGTPYWQPSPRRHK